MKILKGVVDWSQGIDESPDVLLLVDHAPDRNAARFEKRANVYFAEQDGLCRAFTGRGGEWTLGKPTHDGPGAGWIKMRGQREHWIENRTTVSCWRLNSLGFGPCMPIRYTANENNYSVGRGLTGWVRVSMLRDAAHLIDVGDGYSWRPGLASAAGVVFPKGSEFILACCAAGNEYGGDGRRSSAKSIPERLYDGLLVEDVRAAIQAAEAAGQHEAAEDIADRYVRFLGRDAMDILLTLWAYEPAVKLPDGTFWMRPVGG